MQEEIQETRVEALETLEEVTAEQIEKIEKQLRWRTARPVRLERMNISDTQRRAAMSKAKRIAGDAPLVLQLQALGLRPIWRGVSVGTARAIEQGRIYAAKINSRTWRKAAKAIKAEQEARKPKWITPYKPTIGERISGIFDREAA